VQLDFGAGGNWKLTRTLEGWVLDEGTAIKPSATLRMAPQVAWRQLTGLPMSANQCVLLGDVNLASPLLAVRGVIV
jgi:hypothetical protein